VGDKGKTNVDGNLRRRGEKKEVQWTTKIFGFLDRCHALVKMVYLVEWIMSARDLTFGLRAGRARGPPPLTTFSHAFEYFEVEQRRIRRPQDC